MSDKSSESAELIQAKAARSANYIALVGVLITAVGTVGGLAVTVYLTRSDKGEASQTDSGTFTAETSISSEPTASAPLSAKKPKIVKATSQGQRKPSGSADMALDLGDDITLDLALVKAGTFEIGSPSSERGRGYDEGPQHTVKIKSDFYIGKYEVTQMQYEKVMGSNPSHFKDAVSPVEKVSWPEATEFCRRLSESSGRTVRLPTEAEWEYACRAGTTTPFHFGPALNSDKANLDGTSPYGGAPAASARKRTVAVASFPPNPWKIHDMHGNVMEWCGDFYAASYLSKGDPDEDPTGPESGSARTARGGSWSSKAANCRSAERSSKPDTSRSNEIGFRVVVEVE